MNRKYCHKIATALILAMMTLSAWAGVTADIQDEQKGVVRTIKRPDREAVYLSGVSIRRQGGHNAVVSDSAGKFEFVMPDMTVGMPFYLSYIRKSGYELADNGTIGRAFTYSPEVPIEIVMVDIKAKEADVMRITENAYARAEKEYSKRLSELEAGLEAKTVSEESYREQFRQLQESFEKYESLIGKMAERYASTDYADIDSLNASINIAIEAGDLERADSLLSTVGSLERLVEENRSAMSSAHERQRIGRKLVAEAEEDVRKIESDRTRLGDLLYSKYSVCLSRFDNDSAAHYILLRADLDTTNAQWQLDAGNFILEYKADYKYSLSLFQRALRNSLEQYGEYHPEVASSYNSIGHIYYTQGEYSRAFEMYEQSLEIIQVIYDTNHPDVATAYNNLGNIFRVQGNYIEAQDMQEKSLEIRKCLYGTNHPAVAMSYYNLGNVYYCQGDYSSAMEMYVQSLEIRKSLYGEAHQDVAMSYNNIGNVYFSQGYYLKALEMYERSIEINKLIFGTKHPQTAVGYNNLGEVYRVQGEYLKALEMHKKSLDIKKFVYETNHPDIATSYNNLGNVYYSQGNYSIALELYGQALEIRKSIYGEHHSEIAASYNNIGNVYCAQGDYSRALEMYGRALEIRKSVYGEHHPEVAVSYYNVGLIYHTQGDSLKALKMYERALEIQMSIYGEHHPEVAASYYNIGQIYYTQGDYSRALEMFGLSLGICESLYGKDGSKVKELREIIREIKSAEKKDGR